MLKTFEQNTPECKSGNCFHLFYHCKEKNCMLNEPVFTSSLKGVAWPLCLELMRYSKQRKWVYLPFLSKCKQFCVINKHKPTNKKLSYLNEDKLVKESLKIYTKTSLSYPEILKRIHPFQHRCSIKMTTILSMMNLPASGDMFMSKMKGCPVFPAVPTIQQTLSMAIVLATLSHVFITLRKLY